MEAQTRGINKLQERASMLGIQLDVRAFLDRVAVEMGRVDPGEIKAG